MPEGYEGNRLTKYNEDGTVNTNQYVMLNAVEEAESQVKKAKFVVHNATTHEEVVSGIVAFHALRAGITALE